MADVHLRLAGVTRLSVAGRGPGDAFVFDPHRLALPCWALALKEARVTEPVTLVTLDRHFDLTVPADVAAIPDRSADVRALDEHARWRLDVRNTDQVIAAIESGLVGEVIAIARASPAGAFDGPVYRDRRGAPHALRRAPTVERAAAMGLPPGTTRVLLDIDLDCFTTPSDADPTTPVPWPAGLIREFLLPPGSEPFWSEVLARGVCLTLAREPYHCGGLVAAGRLFEAAAEIIFPELLQTDLP